jgi:hypothetical protein
MYNNVEEEEINEDFIDELPEEEYKKSDGIKFKDIGLDALKAAVAVILFKLLMNFTTNNFILFIIIFAIYYVISKSFY